MKKLVSLFLVISMILTCSVYLASCETDKNEETSAEETSTPTENPTTAPTDEPSDVPTAEPTQEPTSAPTAEPTQEPTSAPTAEPTQEPTQEPTIAPTEEPTVEPTEEPTTAPTEEPTAEPTEEPTTAPTEEPTSAPTEEPTAAPTEEPTAEPTVEPTEEPTTVTEAPSSLPTAEPTTAPTEEPTETPIDDIVYENGADIKNAGNKWDADIFADAAHSFDESKAITKTAAEMLELLVNGKTALAAGEVYRVTEPLVLTSDTKYYGNMAAIIAEGGIIIKDVSDIVIKELILKGKITVENSSSITFFKLDLSGVDFGVTIDAASSNIAFKNNRIIVSDTAIVSDADMTSVYQSYLCGKSGIVSNGDLVSIQNCKINAVELGASVKGADCAIRDCTIELASSGTGVVVEDGSSNTLVSLNVIKNAQVSVKVTNSFNCVVLLNSAIRVIGENNKNLYVVENKLGGAIILKNNKYLLCDGNTFNTKDGNPHPTVSEGNTEINGDNVHDVNARVEYGANEEILPHTNKDLFVGMERKPEVKDISQTKSYNVSNYVRMMAKSGNTVIVPPGVYNVSTYILFTSVHANTTIYAYGAMIEKLGREFSKDPVTGALKQTGLILYLQNGASNMTFKGLTIGYDFQPAGQIYVLDKLNRKDATLLVVSNAGYVDDYGKTNPDEFMTSTSYMYRAGELMPWNNVGSSYEILEKREDGTMVLQLTGTDAGKRWTSIGKGDTFNCRLSADNSSTINITSSSNVLLKDFVLYGYSSALAIVVGGRSTGTQLYRVHNDVRAPMLISEETYNKYKALEETYDVDLEVYIDEEGRWRGGIPRVGSVDATHITGSAEGVDATSCIFEHMCDDGSNQRGSSSRLAGYKYNEEDNTYTIYFKGTISETYWGLNTSAKKETASPTMTSTPKEGDRLYAYASNGYVLFDTVALTAATKVTSSPGYHVNCVDKLVNSEIKDGDITEINGIYDNISQMTCVDGLCDVCGKVTHSSATDDGICDRCGATVHMDWNRDGICYINNNGAKCGITLVDADGDGLNDADGVPIISSRFTVSQFLDSTGHLEVTAWYSSGGWRQIVYKTDIYEIKINADEVNREALKMLEENYDLTDNDYMMDHKVLFDNLSMNSAGFTFDNVLIQEKAARGILAKTHDIVIKNCTFRRFYSTGVLLSVETTWGESTVPRNVVVQNCLFDDTGRGHNTETDLKYSCVAIQGLGATGTGKDIVVSPDTLPCRSIKVINNKFVNVNNNYCISISAAQDIVIRDNVFEARNGDTARSYGKAINIQGAMNIEISGNTYSEFAVDENGNFDISKAVIANNYMNLYGKDVEGKLPTEKLPATETETEAE